MANWNEDAAPSKSNIPPQYESLNDLENSCQTLDTSHYIQQASNTISQNSNEHSNVNPFHIPNSDFPMNENNDNKYPSNSFPAGELPPNGTPDWHLSSNLSNGNSSSVPNLPNGNFSTVPNFSSQTSFSNGHQNQIAREALFDADFCKKDDYSLQSILEPWKNNGGGGGYGGNNTNYYTPTFGNTMRNLPINSSVQYENQNNISYPFAGSLSSLNGAIERQSNPQEMKEVYSKKTRTLMQIGGTSSSTPYHSSGNNKSTNGEGMYSTQPSGSSSLSYQNSSFVYNSTNYTNPQCLWGPSIMGQTKSSLMSYPNSTFGYSNSTNYATAQYLGTRSIIGQTNPSLRNPNSSFGISNQNNWSRTSPFDAGTSRENKFLSNELTRGLGQFPRSSAPVIHKDELKETVHSTVALVPNCAGNLSKITNGSVSLESKAQEMNHIASYIREDPYWWKKTDAFTQLIFDQIFEAPIRAENEKKKKEEEAKKRKRKALRREDAVVSKEAATNPTHEGTTHNTSRGVVIKEGSERDNNMGTGKETTSAVDVKEKGFSGDPASSEDTDEGMF